MRTNPESTKKSDRVATRVSSSVKASWMHAAELRGQTLSDFVIVAANMVAAETFREYERIELSRRDQAELAELLSRPPELAETMKKALKKRVMGAKES